MSLILRFRSDHCLVSSVLNHALSRWVEEITDVTLVCEIQCKIVETPGSAIDMYRVAQFAASLHPGCKEMERE